MLQRTWKYGSKMYATVVDRVSNTFVLTDEDGEGHVLHGISHDVQPNKGDGVEMRFCKGGQTGGYWKMVQIFKSK